MNRVMLLGHVYRDPRLANTQNSHLCNFMIEVQEKGYTSGKTYTTKVKCQAWAKMADIAAALKPGNLVFLEGRLTVHQNKTNNQWETNVACNAIEVLSETLPPSRPQPEAQLNDASDTGYIPF